MVTVDGDRATLRRRDADRHVPLGACMPEGGTGDVLALGGGRALTYSYVPGGTWAHRDRSIDEVACLLDFRDGSSRGIRTEIFGDLRGFSAVVGSHTGWLYVRSSSSGLAVLDLEGSRTAALPDNGFDDSQTAIVELDNTVRIAHAELEPTDLRHPISHGHLIVQDFDLTTWPPEVLTARRIDVGGRPDQIVISTDGRWLAYDGSHYDGEAHSAVSDVGLIDLTTGRVEFELLARPGSQEAHDVVIVDEIPFLLASTRTAGPRTGARDVYWLDRTGTPIGRVKQYPGNRLIWLPTFRRVLGVDYQSLDLLDLPPGPGPR